MKNRKIDFMIADDLVRNTETKSYVLSEENDYYNVRFMTKPNYKLSFFKRIKHSFNVLSGIATPVYFFDDIEKYYPKKKNDYIDFRKDV